MSGAGALASEPLNEATRLAIKRTQLGAERTLMAWIRTAFSMISFGFTIGKFLSYLHDKEADGSMPENGGWLPRLLVMIGLVSLLIGAVEFRRNMKELSQTLGETYRVSSVGIIAGLVAILGLLALAGLMVRNSVI
jgi:putative membrane protein